MTSSPYSVIHAVVLPSMAIVSLMSVFGKDGAYSQMTHAPFSVGDEEQLVEHPVEFSSICREMADQYNSNAILLRAVVTVSPVWGLIWRGDYQEMDENDQPVVSRFVCWQLPGHAGTGGFILQDTIVDSSVKPLPQK